MGWINPPSNFIKQVEGDYLVLMAAFALEVHRRLIQMTPVDTGRAQSNWWPAIGSGTSKATEETSPVTSQSEALALFAPGTMPSFPTLYITNNLDYIEMLNNGHSQRAPANFVETIVAEMASVL